MSSTRSYLKSSMNSIPPCIRARKEVVGEVLNRLINYTVEHFAAEEKMMKKNGYPDLPGAPVEHKALDK